MKMKRIKLLVLSSLTILGLGAGLVSCSTKVDVNTSADISTWDKEEEKVIFERRLWNHATAAGINVDDSANEWKYNNANDGRLAVSSTDGTVLFRRVNDEILSEAFETSKPFSVDITMSLNGGREIKGYKLKKGDISILVEALDKNNKVVSRRRLDDPNQFPEQKSMDVVRVTLNTEGRNVRRIRLKYETSFFKNRIEITPGFGRIKVYEGAPKTTTIKDGVTSDYVSDVKYVDQEAHDYETVPTNGIRLSDMRKSNYDLSSRGNQNVLVIPVRFADTDVSKLHVYNSTGQSGKVEIDAKYLGGYDGIRKTIEQAYFGESDETGWESLASYYYKSSGGKLHITGKVSEWYTYPKSVIEFYQESGSESSVYKLVDDATQWYKENFDDYMKFDQNNDGYFDCVEFVYAQPNCNSNSIGVCNKTKYKNSAELFWAFCWKRSGVEPMKNWPMPFTFAWFSYDFLYNAYNSAYIERNAVGEITKLKADTHTVLHENGHALGLADYYSTGYDGSSPLSGIDMMDNNVGDHNSYSKWQFDWYGPKEQVIYDEKDEKTKKYEVTLRPFESTGDFAIIPAYNREELNSGTNPGKLDSSYSEFITIEYYTPTGLNEMDSREPYSYSSGARTMTEAGIKMLHVDSRLAYLSSTSQGEIVFNDYLPVNCDKSLVVSDNTQYVELAHRNDAIEQNYDTGSTNERDYRLISTLLADGNEDKKSNKLLLSNEHLWGSETSKVMDFGITNHQDFQFNNGYKNVYSMSIKEMTKDHVTLVFEYIEAK